MRTFSKVSKGRERTANMREVWTAGTSGKGMSEDRQLPVIFNLTTLIRLSLSFGNFSNSALVDTGAGITLLAVEVLRKIPEKNKEKVKSFNSEGPRFRTAAGHIISSLELNKITFQIDDSKFTYPFYVVDKLEEGIILGIDFLKFYKFKIDVEKEELTFKDNKTKSIQLKNKGQLQVTSLKIHVEEDKFNLAEVKENLRPKLRQLLSRYHDLFATKLTELGTATVVKHSIRTSGVPVCLPVRRTPIVLREAIKAHIDEMLEHGIIRESNSPYASPIVMVPKKGGELRFCIDYRELNKQTIKDKYPLPRIDETIESLYGATIFSTLDLFSGYWQIEIEQQDKFKTSFVCEFGQYEFNRMPFGLTNAPSTFQRLMNSLLRPLLNKSVLVYLDDIIVYSSNFEDHLRHLSEVFELLKNAGLKLKLKKCSFAQEKIDYLGHVVSGEGVSPNKQNVQAILQFPEPTTIKQLQSFLGLANYYRRFIRAFADKAHHLTRLTRKDVKWEWGDRERQAFTLLKDCLATKPVLGYPDFARKFFIQTDASDYGIGAVLGQIQGQPQSEREVVIAYTSKHLQDRELKWTVSEKEAYAIVHAVTVFRPYLYGRSFKVFTDHRPLEWLMSKKEPAGRLARWALKLQEYQIEIAYKSGKSNQNADCLSRNPVCHIEYIFSDVSLAEAETDSVKNYSTVNGVKSVNTKVNREASKEQKVNPVISKENPDRVLATPDFDPEETDKYGKLFVPVNKRVEVLQMNHDHVLAGHLGVERTYQRLRRQFTWPGMLNDVKDYVRSCVTCARRKAIGAVKAPLVSMPLESVAWSMIAMDIVGPLPESDNGNKYILVICDYATRYSLTFPMADQRASTVAKILVYQVFAKFGAPVKLLSDRGTNFVSELVAETCKLFQVKRLITTAYHPQTDGLVERFNRTLIDMLAAYTSEKISVWDEYLPLVTLAYNTSKHTSLRHSPFYLLFGRDAVLPIETLPDIRIRLINEEQEIGDEWQKAKELALRYLEANQVKQKNHYDANSKIIEVKIGDLVYYKNHRKQHKLTDRWKGPYKVTNILSEVTVEIADESNVKMVVHINDLKPAATRKIQSPQQMNVPQLKKKAGRPKAKKEPKAVKKRGRPKKQKIKGEGEQTSVKKDTSTPNTNIQSRYMLRSRTKRT